MQNFSSSPLELIKSLLRNRSLIVQMSKRDVLARYRGSVFGLVWSFITPLIMLTIYTFVFTVVFKARWGIIADQSQSDYAIILYSGLLVHGFFAECLAVAPVLIVANTNYVKKVVFPLEVLPCITVINALFQATIGLVVLLLAQLVMRQEMPVTIILFPFVVAPLIFATLGVIWFFAALGVYLRDLSHLTGLISTVLLFISAVFFPLSALPPKAQLWLQLNPLATLIQQCREVLVFGTVPNLFTWACLMILGLLMAWLGFASFQKIRRGFADVL